MAKKTTKRRPSRKAKSQGMNWIRKPKRYAIYRRDSKAARLGVFVRDGLACCWCGAGVEDPGVRLTLDHIVPYADGGSNHSDNLISSCRSCNSRRGSRSAEQFAREVGGDRAIEILSHIRVCLARPIDVAEAKALIDRRGGDFVATCRKDRS
jgi:5-methylcytosine-specific restriction endonuclease McrA